MESPAGEAAPSVTIFDLTEVPYVDSSGIGLIVGHYVRCKGRGVRVIAAGVTPGVHQAFRMMRVDTFIPMTSTIEEADGGSVVSR
jgi:anti-anti-sigma factor